MMSTVMDRSTSTSVTQDIDHSSDHSSLLLGDINNDMIAKDDEDASLSESRFTEEGDFADELAQEGGNGEDFEHVSKSSVSSMSVFMSSLVGLQLQSDDFSFCLQADNAKPRGLQPPPPPPSSASNVTSLLSDGSSSKGSKNRNKISRWESTPMSAGKSPNSVVLELAAKRPKRAMRPWKPPASSNNSSNVGSGSSSVVSDSNSSQKTDMPIPLPKRSASNRSLINAKRPQRSDSNRSLTSELSSRSFKREVSLKDITKDAAIRQQLCRNDSMDLRVLLECEELDDDYSHENDTSGSDNSDGQQGGVYLKIPNRMMTSDRSLWGSASTMSASLRTMISMKSITSEQSTRSLYWQAERDETAQTPMRPPTRTASRDDPFQSNASERPVRRPVRTMSNRSMISSSCGSTISSVPACAADAVDSQQQQQELSPPSAEPTQTKQLKQDPPSRLLLFRLVRSASEQTLERIWRETKGEGLYSEAVRSLLKRSISDSRLLMTKEEILSSDK